MGRISVAFALCLGLATTGAKNADAQDPPFDAAVDIQLFEYAVGPKSFFAVPNAELAAHMQFQVDMMLTFLTNPLVLFDFDENTGERTGERTGVVENILAGQIGGAIGYRDRFQFGVAIPLVFGLWGEGVDPATGNMDPGGLQATGLGDIRGEAKMRLARAAGFTASGVAQVSLPTSIGSSDSMFLGDNTPSARVGGLAQWRSSDKKATVGATAGLMLRKPRKIYETEVGQQLTYGVAASYVLHPKVAVTGETFGRIGFDFDGGSTPLEAIAGGTLKPADGISVTIGGGGGILGGVGSPGIRMFPLGRLRARLPRPRW